MTPDDLNRFLSEVVAADRAAAERFRADPDRPGLRRTPACVPLSRLGAWVASDDRDAAGVDTAHVRDCEYCQAAVRKLAAPPPDDDVVVPSGLAVRQPVWAEPDLAWDARLVRGGGADPAPTPGAPAVWTWHVGDEPGPDGGTLPLAPDLVARCYDTPDVQRVAVVVTAVLRPGGGWEAAVELDPGPNRDVMFATLTFADGTTREFPIPPNPPGELRAAAGSAGVIPASAIPEAGGWRGTIVLE